MHKFAAYIKDMLALQTHRLAHRFTKENWAVQDLDLNIPASSIYCFLGPNGAGKTTTLRLLLGLIQPTGGQISFFPNAPAANRPALMQRIGACIEVPSLYHHLNAEQNLKIYATIYATPRERIEEVLRIVDLMHAKAKKVSHYSLGMKQRLSIAIALLHRPELVILDEPTNGLDPQGIVEIRQTITHLNKSEGITFLISSHLLAEVEKLATHVGIIHQGSLRFEGSMSELYAASAHHARWIIRTDNDDLARAFILQHFELTSVDANSLCYADGDADLGLRINRMLHQNNIGVYEIAQRQHDLESHFLRLIQNS